MGIKFDINGNIEPFTLILCHKNHSVYGIINTVSDLIFCDNIQPGKEISFTVHKELTSQDKTLTCGVWDDIKDLRYVFIPELDEYFEIHVPVSDAGEVTKQVTGTSACVTELSNILLYDIQINTEDDIAREDYKSTVFYDAQHPDASLLHRIFEKAKHYSIQHVDSSLAKLKRTFSISDTSLYEFCTQTLSEELGCLFSFDSSKRAVYVYDLWNICQKCGYRGDGLVSPPQKQAADSLVSPPQKQAADGLAACPKCGSTQITAGYGEDTTIFVSKENLAQSLSLESKQEEIKNCFNIEGGDDLVTSAVINALPNGSSYIYYFSEEMQQDMSPALTAKLNSYQALSDSYAAESRKLAVDIYDCYDKKAELTSKMMPNIEAAETNAQKQLALLTTANLSPVAVTDASSVSRSTADSAILGMTGVVCHSNFKIEIVSSQLTSQTWSGKFKVTNYSDKEDTAVSASAVFVLINDDYEKYIKQKLDKALAKDDTNGLFDLLSITDLTAFTAELKKYCQNRLTSFENSLQTCLELLAKQQCGDKNAYPDLYQKLYQPYYNKLSAVQKEKKIRDAEILTVSKQLEALLNRQLQIQSALDFDRYLGTDLLKEFYTHRRENKYVNSNYISDGLTNQELFELAQELIENAQKELKKSAQKKYTLNASMANLLKLSAFRPLLSSFRCGNWIRIQVDQEIFKLRILAYQVNFDSGENGSNIDVTFSDVSKSNDLSTEMNNIISQAKSMAGSYSYITRQAQKGEIAKTTIDDMRTHGLYMSNLMVTNANTEDIVYGKNGILCRSYNDITGEYDPTQLKIIHNTINITDDGWRTSRLSFGESLIDGQKYFGLFADFVNAGKIWGTDIMGGTITGTVFNNGNGTFKVDKNGNLTAGSATLSGIVTAKGGSKIGGFQITDTAITNSKFSMSDNSAGVYLGTDGISLGNSYNNFSVDSSGTCNASYANIAAGRLGDWNLVNGWIISNNFGSGLASGSGTDDVVFWTGNVQGSGNIGSAPFLIKNDGTMFAAYVETERIVSFDTQGRPLDLAPTLRNVLDRLSFPSDSRLKYNIQNSSVTALDYINQIRHREFYWRDDQRCQQLGYIAQELKEINSNFSCSFKNPDTLSGEEEYIEQVSMQGIFPYITKSIQELSDNFNDLKNQFHLLLNSPLP